MEEDCEEPPVVVIDNGSSMCRSGFAGDDSPISDISSCLGKPRYEGMVGLYDRDSYVGDEAQRRRGILSMAYPIQRGVVTDWDDMERFWKHLYSDQLGVLSEEHPLLLSDPPLNPKTNREKMTEVIFESLSCPSFYVALQALLSLYSSGRGSGIVCESGDGVTQIVPVYEGHMITPGIRRSHLAGSSITENLAQLLGERSYHFSVPDDMEIVRDIKDKFCYAAVDLEKDVKLATETSELNKSYELPDGGRITIGAERFKSAEAFFQPHLLGLDLPGIHDLLFGSLMSCDIDVRKDLYCNIILSGGAAKLQGFPERLRQEMAGLVPPHMKVKTVACPEREVQVWIGGSILASLSSFQSMWITREEYEETGVDIVHKKCF